MLLTGICAETPDSVPCPRLHLVDEHGALLTTLCGARVAHLATARPHDLEPTLHEPACEDCERILHERFHVKDPLAVR